MKKITSPLNEDMEYGIGAVLSIKSIGDELFVAVYKYKEGKKLQPVEEFLMENVIINKNTRVINYLEKISGENISLYSSDNFDFQDPIQIRMQARGCIHDKVGSFGRYSVPIILEVRRAYIDNSMEFVISNCYADYDNFSGSLVVLLDLEFKLSTLKDADIAYFFKRINIDMGIEPVFIYDGIEFEFECRRFNIIHNIILNTIEGRNRDISNAQPSDTSDYAKLNFLRRCQHKSIKGFKLEPFTFDEYYSTGSGWGTQANVKVDIIVNEEDEWISYINLNVKLKDRPYCGEDVEDVERAVAYQLDEMTHEKSKYQY